MFMIYSHTIFHMYNSSVSLIVAIRLKAINTFKEVMLFTIKLPYQRLNIFQRCTVLRYIISGPYVKWC